MESIIEIFVCIGLQRVLAWCCRNRTSSAERFREHPYGRLDATDDEVEAFAAVVLPHFIDSLPPDTIPVGESGIACPLVRTLIRSQGAARGPSDSGARRATSSVDTEPRGHSKRTSMSFSKGRHQLDHCSPALTDPGCRRILVSDQAGSWRGQGTPNCCKTGTIRALYEESSRQRTVRA